MTPPALPAETSSEGAGAQPDTRERILIEAERLFRHYGYSKTTVADIAQALSMSPANIYRFFSSKSEINEAICDRMLTAKEAMARQALNAPLPASARLRLMAVGAHRDTIETLIGETKVHEMVVVAMEEQWGTVAAHIQRVIAMLAKVIEEGIAAGEFREQDPVLAARCFHQCMVSLVYPQIVVLCRQDPGNYASVDDLVSFALTALRK